MIRTNPTYTPPTKEPRPDPLGKKTKKLKVIHRLHNDITKNARKRASIRNTHSKKKILRLDFSKKPVKNLNLFRSYAFPNKWKIPYLSLAEKKEQQLRTEKIPEGLLFQ